MVELMVTIVIVAVMAATVGTFFVKLLTIQEREREEGYIREKLCDICAQYADFLSLGDSVSVGTNRESQALVVGYRQEAGGVSFETGLVTRVAYFVSTISATNRMMDLNVCSREPESSLNEYPFMGNMVSCKLSRKIGGDAPLIPLTGDMVSCTITPLGNNVTPGSRLLEEDQRFETTDATLGYLEVTARYKVKNDEGEYEERTASAGRIVRLWNRE